MADPTPDYPTGPMRSVAEYEVWEVDARLVRVDLARSRQWLSARRGAHKIDSRPCSTKYWSLPILCDAQDTAAMAERGREPYYSGSDGPELERRTHKYRFTENILGSLPAEGPLRIVVERGIVRIQSTDLSPHTEIELKAGAKIVIVNPDGSEFVVKCSEPEVVDEKV